MCITVIGYPKSGNTWLSRLIRTAKRGSIGILENELNWVDSSDQGEGPVVVYKTHNTSGLSARQAVYIVRNPYDVVISSFYHNKPWLRNKKIMTFCVGKSVLNLWALVYGCNWPGLGTYNDHYSRSQVNLVGTVKYESIKKNHVPEHLIEILFESKSDFQRAILVEKKEKKINEFRNSGDTKSLNFISGYNSKKNDLWPLTKRVIFNRSYKIFKLYS